MLIVYGCGGHARSILDVLIYNGQNDILIVDKNARKNEYIYGYRVLSYLPDQYRDEPCILAVGDNTIRKKMVDEQHPANFINVIATTAYISARSRLGVGIYVSHLSYIGPEANIDNHTIINTRSVIEHEVCIGKFCHIAPNVTISGRTRIGDMVFIGAGSTIIDKIKISSNVIIGANSTVISDVTEPGVYVGSPLRRIR